MRSIELRFLNHLRLRKNWLKQGTYVRDQFFSSGTTRIVYRAICDLFKEDTRRKRVKPSEIYHWAETKHADKKTEVRELLRRMKQQGLKKDDPSLVRFLQQRMVEGALNDGIECLSEPDGMRRIGMVRDTIDAAIRLQHGKKRFYPYFARASQRTEVVRTGHIPTLFSRKLDRELGGGLAVGELGVFIGPTGRGKSQILCNLAASALLSGHNVLYCTLQDISDLLVARRIDQILLGVSEKQIVKRPKRFKRLLREIADTSGELYIRDFTDQPVSLLDIRSSVETLIEDDSKPGMLVVDYVDTMVSHTRDLNEQIVFANICQGFRSMGRELHFPVWTACQGNRESLDADDVRLSHIAGPVAKLKTADVIAGMCQKPDEKEEGYMRIEILKTRMSSDLASITVFTDPKTMQMWGRKNDLGRGKRG